MPHAVTVFVSYAGTALDLEDEGEEAAGGAAGPRKVRCAHVWAFTHTLRTWMTCSPPDPTTLDQHMGMMGAAPTHMGMVSFF